MTPGDETPRPARPAPEIAAAPETAARSPFLQGVRGALAIFAGIAALEAITFLGSRLTGDNALFIVLGLLIAGGGVAVLVLAGSRLPRGARLPFWAVGVICFAISFVLWGATCGLLAG
jgi:hypothetical protein